MTDQSQQSLFDLANTPPVTEAKGLSLDSISKALAVLAVLVYICGFLITSIHSAKYGFVEPNPLRFRLIAAGLWFVGFIGLPAFITRKIVQMEGFWKSELKWWVKLPSVLIVCWFAAQWTIYYLARWAFVFDPMPLTGWHVKTWEIIAFLVAALAIFVLIQSAKFPRVNALILYVVLAFFLYSPIHNLFFKGYFEPDALTGWMFIVGIVIFLEGHYRGCALISAIGLKQQDI